MTAFLVLRAAALVCAGGRLLGVALVGLARYRPDRSRRTWPRGTAPARPPPGSVSKASTRAPKRLAVAMACRPATPAPIANTLRRGNGARWGHHRGHYFGAVERRLRSRGPLN